MDVIILRPEFSSQTMTCSMYILYGMRINKCKTCFPGGRVWLTPQSAGLGTHCRSGGKLVLILGSWGSTHVCTYITPQGASLSMQLPNSSSLSYQDGELG